MMRSTFAGFTTAFLGMSASQRALEVTGQNIANVNTEGYTRQRLDIASLNLRSGDFYNSNPNAKIGFGVEITGVSRIRDPFLDIQYRTQMSKLGTTDAHMDGYEKLADVLDETVMVGLRDAFKDLNSQLQALHANTGQKEYDSMVRSSAQNLLNLFREDAVRLQEVREDMVNEFRDTTVKDLNGILKNIAELNETIKNSHVLGNPALELMDQRDMLLDELSSYLPVTTNYWDHEIAPGVKVEELDIYAAVGNRSFTLVSGNRYGKFEAETADSHEVQLSLTDANFSRGDVYYKDDNGNSLPNGVLKGMLDILNKSGGFDEPATDVRGIGYYEKSLDGMARELADLFNGLNQAVKTNADGTIAWEYEEYKGDPTRQNENGQYVDADGNLIYRMVGDGKYELYPGGNVVMTQLFTRKKDIQLVDRPLFTTLDDNTTGITALNIKIAEGWEKGRYGITASKVPVIENGEEVIGSKANENVLKMIEAFNGGREFSYQPGRDIFFTGSFYDCFTNMENVLAIDQKGADNTLKNKINVINQTADLRDSISGVSLDEEGVNLLQYQQSFTAAARLMTTLDEALDKLINGTGVVGR